VYYSIYPPITSLDSLRQDYFGVNSRKRRDLRKEIPLIGVKPVTLQNTANFVEYQ